MSITRVENAKRAEEASEGVLGKARFGGVERQIDRGET